MNTKLIILFLTLSSSNFILASDTKKPIKSILKRTSLQAGLASEEPEATATTTKKVRIKPATIAPAALLQRTNMQTYAQPLGPDISPENIKHAAFLTGLQASKLTCITCGKKLGRVLAIQHTGTTCFTEASGDLVIRPHFAMHFEHWHESAGCCKELTLALK